MKSRRKAQTSEVFETSEVYNLNGFKETEMGYIPNDWDVTRIGDLAARKLLVVKNGFACGTHNQEGSGIPHLRPFNVDSSGQINLETIKYIEIDKDVSDYFLQPRDVLFNNTNSEELVGKTAYWNRSGEYALSNHMTIIRVTNCDELDPFFLATLLHKYWYDRYYQSICRRHVNQASISLARLLGISLALPPLPEQRAIAHVLSTIQRAIAAQDAVIAAAREVKRSLMQRLFTYGPYVDPLPTQETEIGEVPEAWQVMRLGDMAELITKGSSPNWQGFEYQDEGIVFVRSQNVGWGRLELSEVAFLPEEFNRKERKSVIRRDDLLMNIVGASIGRAALASTSIDGGNLNQAVALVRLYEGFDPRFAMNFILSEPGQEQQHRQKKEIARANLSLQDIGNLLVPVPPLEEQRSISEVLTAADSKIENEESRKIALQALFKSMLHQLMTGQVRVKTLTPGPSP
jgi:type I restriction enzyme S subunit